MLFWKFAFIAAAAVSLNAAHGQLIANYNADDQTLGAANVFTDTTGANDATGSGTVENTGNVFNGHQYMNFGANQGFATGNLYSGSDPRTVAAVYTNPSGDNGSINPIAGEAGAGTTGVWFVLQSRSLYVNGDPYLAGFFDDVGSGTAPAENQLTFSLATYDGTTETLYWAYGLTGAVQSASNITTLDTTTNSFEIGEDSDEPSQGDMQIGQVQVYDTSMTSAQAASDIKGLQAYYAIAVPEPSTYALMGVSLLAGALFLRRRSA